MESAQVAEEKFNSGVAAVLARYPRVIESDDREAYNDDSWRDMVVTVSPVVAVSAEAAPVGLPAENEAEPCLYWNDALVVGASDLAELDPAIFDRQITVAMGGIGTRRGKKDNYPKNVTLTVGEFCDRFLTRFEEGLKDGRYILQGELVGDHRKGENVRANYFWMTDHDTGETLKELADKARNSSTLTLLWHTHSNMRPTTGVKEKAILAYLERKGCPVLNSGDVTAGQLADYLVEVKKVRREYMTDLKRLPNDHTEGGVELVLEHTPYQRLRKLEFLEKAFVFASRGGTHAEGMDEWKERYAGGSIEQGIAYDTQCVDPARLMYTPRIAKRADIATRGHEIMLIVGKPRDFNSLPRHAEEKKQARSAMRGHAAISGRGAHVFKTKNMSPFLRQYGSDFEVADFLREHYGEEGVRAERGEGACDFDCPFKDDHSPSEGEDTGFHARNASANEGAGFLLLCLHGCKERTGRDRAVYLDAFFQMLGIEDAFDPRVLAYCPNKRDELVRWRDAEALAADEKAMQDAIRELSSDTALAPVERILRALAVFPDEELAAAQLMDQVVDRTRGSKWKGPTLRQHLKRLRKERQAADGSADGDEAYLAKMEEFNRRFAVVALGSDARVIKFSDQSGAPLEMLKRSGFYDVYAPDKIFSPARNKVVNTTHEWWNWRERKTFERAVFDPSNNVDASTLNLWRGFGVEGQQGDWSLLRGHLFENVCRFNPYWFAWVISWLANLVQEPGNKPGSAIVLKGVKGTGKTKSAEWIAKLAPNNAKIVAKKDQILGRFNSHLRECIFACMEETFWAGDLEAEGILKDLITGATQLIEAKGVDSIQLANHVRVWICSNNDWVVPATDDERRFFVTEMSERRLKDIAYFKSIDQQMASGGLAGMMFDLRRLRQPSWIELRTPPATPWLVEQVERSLKVTEAWWHSVLTDGGFTGGSVDEGWPDNSPALSPDMARDARVFSGKGAENLDLGWMRIATDDAYEHYKAYARDVRRRPATKEQMGAFLGDVGGKKCRPRGRDGQRVNSYDLPPLGELRSAFSKKYGIKFDASEGTNFADIIPEDWDGVDAELKAWQRYGGGGALPE